MAAGCCVELAAAWLYGLRPARGRPVPSGEWERSCSDFRRVLLGLRERARPGGTAPVPRVRPFPGPFPRPLGPWAVPSLPPQQEPAGR